VSGGGLQRVLRSLEESWEIDDKGGMMKALLVGSVDKALNPQGMGFFWKPAFDSRKISVDFFDFERHVPESIDLMNKTSYRLAKRNVFDSFFRKAEKRFFSHLETADYDLIMFCGGKRVRGSCLKKARKLQKGAKFINVFNDNPFFDFTAFKAIPDYDLFFVKDSYVLGELEKLGLSNCRYLPQAFSEVHHKRYDDKDLAKIPAKERKRLSSDISFIGSIYPQRQVLLEGLKGFRLKLWGKTVWNSVDRDSWIMKHHMDEIAAMDKKSRIMALSKINLNTHHYQNDIFGTNKRMFEICGCGGFQLVDHKKDMDSLFRPGKELAVFSDVKDMREKARYYLDNPNERKRIADAGYRRALSGHTYTHRLADILKALKKSR